MTVTELDAFLAEVYPQVFASPRMFEVAEAGWGHARVVCPYSESHLRPGGTISGPTMMTLADCGLYVAVLASIGPVALAVTTSLTINFLRKPAQRALIAETRLLKVGRRLAVGDVTIFSDGASEPVAHATGTYSVPPDR